jgi:hypothetical protein
MRLRPDGVVLGAWLVLSGLLFSLVAPRTEVPGLYYDEAFLAQQAKDFLEPGRGILHPGSTRQVEILGRPFPLRNAVYLGSLKSQLLIPGFALFGSSVAVLRLTTLAWSLLALLLTMLWARRLLGTGAALLGGLLIATDPTYVFLSVHEWGPFTTLFLCRAAGFLLLTWGWPDRRWIPSCAGGFLLGLGVYARADFVIVVAAALLALAWVRPGILRDALGTRLRLLLGVAASLAAGAMPMLVSAGDLVATTGSPLLERGDLFEKWRLLRELADGSHSYRLMAVGGRFELVGSVASPAGVFGFAVLLGAIGVLWPGSHASPAHRAAGRFLLGTSALVALGMLALPGAVRAHHMLSVLPFVQLFVAASAVRWWRRGAGFPALRWAVALALVAVLAGNAWVLRETLRLVSATGGRGLWSAAIAEPARELEADPGLRGISLDWGFHEPLLFLTRNARLLEPIWEIGPASRSAEGWRFEGDAGDLYLVHDRDYDLFGFGPRFLAAARSVEEGQPGSVVLRAHHDREGQVAFHSVRFRQDHEIHYRRIFRIELRGPGPVPRPRGPDERPAEGGR